jgi:hypothetical protein
VVGKEKGMKFKILGRGLCRDKIRLCNIAVGVCSILTMTVDEQSDGSLAPRCAEGALCVESGRTIIEQLHKYDLEHSDDRTHAAG